MSQEYSSPADGASNANLSSGKQETTTLEERTDNIFAQRSTARRFNPHLDPTYDDRWRLDDREVDGYFRQVRNSANADMRLNNTGHQEGASGTYTMPTVYGTPLGIHTNSSNMSTLPNSMIDPQLQNVNNNKQYFLPSIDTSLNGNRNSNALFTRQLVNDKNHSFAANTPITPMSAKRTNYGRRPPNTVPIDVHAQTVNALNATKKALENHNHVSTFSSRVQFCVMSPEFPNSIFPHLHVQRICEVLELSVYNSIAELQGVLLKKKVLAHIDCRGQEIEDVWVIWNSEVDVTRHKEGILHQTQEYLRHTGTITRITDENIVPVLGLLRKDGGRSILSVTTKAIAEDEGGRGE